MISIPNKINEIIKELRISGYAWSEIADIINEQFNYDFKPDSYRKKYSRLKRLNTNNDSINLNKEELEYLANDINATSDALDLRINNIIDKKKLNDERSQVNAMYRALAREDTIKEIAHNYAVSMNKDKQLDYVKHLNSNSDKVGLLLISDWHYGIEIDNFYNTYNVDIAKKRIANLRDQVIRICQNDSIDNLIVLNLGDMIAGNIHLPLRLNSRKDVISQIMEVSELIAEFLNDLSNYFSIRYFSVIDNHSRIDPNKKESIQLESLCRITDWYLKERVPNIAIYDNKYGLDIANFRIFDFNVLATHGDKDKPGSIIDKLSLYTKTHYDLICSAHYHHFSYNEDNDTILIGNGSLMGTDLFAHDLRLNNKASLTLIICSKDNVVDSIHKINL